MNTIATVLVLFCIVVQAAVAQDPITVYSQWHFGTGGFYPREGPSRSGCMAALEGCAVYHTSLLDPRDPSGSTYWSILTDGTSVFDQNCMLAINGSGLMGHPSSSQSALIVPHPGDSTKFFIFTAGAGPYVNDSNNGIRYSEVFPFGPYLQVGQKNITLLDTATEKLVGVGHCNDRDYWVIAHGWGNNNFYAWLVNDEGVSSQPVISSVGAVHSRAAAEYTIGYMKASPNGRKLAVVCNSMMTVQLFDFDNETGVVSNPISLPSVGSRYSGEYGLSFSPNNTRLYVSGLDSVQRSSIYQYTVTGTASQIIASRQLIVQVPIVGNPSNQITALQLYKDGTIICARAQSRMLGVIEAPDSLGSLCNYEHDGVETAGGESSFGLPNNIDKHFNTGQSCYVPRAGFSRTQRNICAGECINFTDNSRHQPTAWKWLFPGGDPAVSTQRNPTNICYRTPGTYSVTLIVSNDRGADTVVYQGVVVVWGEPQANAGPDVSICLGESTVLSASGGSEYLWSPDYRLSNRNSASPTARPLKTTAYSVRVKNGACIGYDTVLVTVLPSPIIAPAYYTVCAGDSVCHVFPASGTYSWSPSAGVSDSSSHRPWLKPVSTTRYTVTLTDSNGCTASAVVEVRVASRPTVEAGADITVCPGATAQLRAQASETGGSYAWSPATGLSRTDVANPQATLHRTTTYTVVYTSPQGCSAVDRITVTVSQPLLLDAGQDTAVCAGNAVELRAVGTAGRYQWTPVTGLENPSRAVTLAWPTTTTMYYVHLTDGNGCTAVDSVLVSVLNATVRAGADVSVCKGEKVKLRATGGGSNSAFLWSPAEDLDDPKSRTPIATPKATTVYTVVLTEPNGCTAVDEVVVYVSTTGSVDAGEDRTVCSGGVVQLSASGLAGSYLWTPADGLSDPTSENPVASPAQTTKYAVLVRSPGGCEARDTVLVTVLQKPELDAGSDVSVCRGGAVQLRAIGDAGRYYWEPATGLDNPTSFAPIASPLQTTTYRVTLIANNGCLHTDSLTVVVDDSVAVHAGNDLAICAGESVQLRVSPTAGTVLWQPADGLDNPTSFAPIASPLQTTTYRATVTDATGCSGSDEITVSVFPVPALSAHGDTTLCSGSSSALSIEGSEGAVLWTPTDGLNDATSRTPVASPRITTLYRVVLTAAGGCTVTDSVLVVVNTPPVVNAVGDTTVCSGQPVVLSAFAGSGSYRWEPAHSVEQPDQPTTRANPVTSTLYRVRYVDEAGCTAEDSVFVLVEQGVVATLVIPDTVAAAGDRKFRLPLLLRSSASVSEPLNLVFTLRYASKVLKCTGISRGSVSEVLQGDEAVLTVRMDDVLVVPGETVVAELAMLPLMSSLPATPVLIEVDRIASAACVTLYAEPGAVSVNGICIDNDVRFFRRMRLVIGPNPASDVVRVHVVAPPSDKAGAQPVLQLQTLWGTTLPLQYREESKAGDSITFLCDVAALASGTYNLVVSLGGQQYSYPVCIIR